MNWKKLKQKLLFAAQYIPLTLNSILFGAGVLFLFRRFNFSGAQPEDPEFFLPFVSLMGKTAFLLFLFAIILSLLSTLYSYLNFLWLYKKRGLDVDLDFYNQGAASKDIRYKAVLEKVRRPFLGTVRSRLIYDDGLLTPKLNLLGNTYEKGKFFRKGIFGKQALELPDIKNYQLKGSFLFFEDMLHLFSFAVWIDKKGNFFQAPRSRKTDFHEINPQNVVEEQQRTEESKPIPGDYVNYKSFERGDDIRRIVWKIYAKNGELVVRIPENRDFYASHLNFYASFHSALPGIQINNSFGAEMLNHYKNCIWSAIETLMKKEIPLKFLPDQPLELPEKGTAEREIQMTLSNAVWQWDKTLNDYLSQHKNGVLCISSFNDEKDIEQLLDKLGRDTVVYFVPLSYTFHNWLAWTWLKRIFFKPPTNRLKKIRARWPFSPLKYRVVRHEKRILKCLDDYGIRYGILK